MHPGRRSGWIGGADWSVDTYHARIWWGRVSAVWRWWGSQGLWEWRNVSEDREIKGQISFQRWRIIEIVVQIKAMVYMLDVEHGFFAWKFWILTCSINAKKEEKRYISNLYILCLYVRLLNIKLFWWFHLVFLKIQYLD